MSGCRVERVTWPDAKSSLETIRRKVFVHEQNVPEEEEWDNRDPEALHFLAYDMSNQKAVGTVRLLPEGKITRMAVLKNHRGQGIGAALLREALDLAKHLGKTQVYLDAQVEAIGFYQKYGFIAVGDVFLDAGIPHRRMTLALGVPL